MPRTRQTFRLKYDNMAAKAAHRKVAAALTQQQPEVEKMEVEKPADQTEKRTSLSQGQPRNLNTLWDEVKSNPDFSNLDPSIVAYLKKRVELKDNFLSSRNYNRCLRDIYAFLTAKDEQDKQHALESAHAIVKGKERKPRNPNKGLDADGNPVQRKPRKQSSKKDVKKEDDAEMSTSDNAASAGESSM